mgnify:CR=1 FL=1
MTLQRQATHKATPLARCLTTTCAILHLAILAILPMAGNARAWAQPSDGERLGMAIDYFQDGKYHEAMLILQDLDSRYKLNPRFQAYLGVCFYYEWDYKQANECLDKAIPKLTGFAPQERSFYYFANAESLFNLRQYDRALDNYRQMLTLCHDNEKGDAYYKIGVIHTFHKEWAEALDNLQSAWHYYTRYNPGKKARIAQIRNMIQGCCDKINGKGT